MAQSAARTGVQRRSLGIARYLLGCGALLGALELSLRAVGFSDPRFHEPDRMLGKRLRAGCRGVQSREGFSHVSVNRHGFRGPDRSVAKPEDALRIAVMGDSFVEALHVEYEESLAGRLESVLGKEIPQRRVEVLNFGVSGYGTGQELMQYRSSVARFSPDVVLLALYTGNDLVENHPGLARDRRRSFLLPGPAGEIHVPAPGGSMRRSKIFLEDRFRIAQLRRVVKAERRAAGERAAIGLLTGQAGLAELDAEGILGREAYAYDFWNYPLGPQAWEITQWLLNRFADEVRGSGARLLVAAVGTALQCHPDPVLTAHVIKSLGLSDLFGAENAVEAACRAAGVPFIGLGKTMRAHAHDTGHYLYGFRNFKLGFGHWNAAGHAVATDHIAARLLEVLK